MNNAERNSALQAKLKQKLAQQTVVEDALETPAEPEVPPPQFSLHIAANRMAAYLRVKVANNEQEVLPEQILDFLTENKIEYGIRLTEIKKFCKAKQYYQELVCAKGVKPINGEDGTLTYHIAADATGTPREREDGSVDFRNLDLIHNVRKGDVLCSRTMPIVGKDGIDVYNQIVNAFAGKEVAFPSGNNTEISEDGLSLLAATDGCVERQRGVLNINEVYTLRDGVNSATGNIDALGSLVIYGEVREGFTVKAGRDIEIRGMAEGAFIEAGGNIVLTEGMNGMNLGSLKAGGNISGKFFENLTIECEGDLSSGILLNCRVKAGGSIILKGRKAALIGGKCQAGNKISAATIGTPSYVETTVILDGDNISGKLDKEQIKPNENLQEKIEELTQQLQMIEEKTRAPEAASLQVKRLLLVQSTKIKTAIHQLEQLKQQRKAQTAELQDYVVLALQRAYPSVKIVIGPYTLRLEQPYDSSKFYLDENGITFGPVLPSDR